MPRPALGARCRAAGALALGLRGALLALVPRCRPGLRAPRALLAPAPGPHRFSSRAPSARLSLSFPRRPLPYLPPRSRRTYSADSASQLATTPEIGLDNPDVPPPPPSDVFLSHDWGIDELQRSNHERVTRVNEALKARGFVTWLDEERLEGYIIDQISEGIERAKVVVVFMTQQYYDKVNGDDSADYCKLEFEYALRRRGRANMVVCVMEPRMRDSRQWQGPVGLGLGGSLYVDMADDADLERAVDRLAELVRGRTGAREGAATAELVGPVLETRGAGAAAAGPQRAAAPLAAGGLLSWLPKPASVPQAIFLLLVAMAAVVYYAFEIGLISASEVFALLQDFFTFVVERILALIAAL